MRIRWIQKALDNLDAAVEYIAEDNATVAHKAAQKIWDTDGATVDRPAWSRAARSGCWHQRTDYQRTPLYCSIY